MAIPKRLRSRPLCLYRRLMQNSGFARRVALSVAGLAVVGMGFTVGCSPKQAPAPTQQTEDQVDSKRSVKKEPEAKPQPKKSFEPQLKAPAAPTAKPGD